MYLNKLGLKKQFKEISKAKYVIEKIVGPITSFRAPALRTNKFTFEILMKCGFTHDSSRCPRRFDAFLTPGATKEKLKFINSPKEAYHIHSDLDSTKKLIEVPISSFFLVSTLRTGCPLLIKSAFAALILSNCSLRPATDFKLFLF